MRAGGSLSNPLPCLPTHPCPPKRPAERGISLQPTRLTSDRGNGLAPSDCHFPACIRTACFFSARALFLAPARNYFLRLSARHRLYACFGTITDCHPAVDRPRELSPSSSSIFLSFHFTALSARTSRRLSITRRCENECRIAIAFCIYRRVYVCLRSCDRLRNCKK